MLVERLVFTSEQSRTSYLLMLFNLYAEQISDCRSVISNIKVASIFCSNIKFSSKFKVWLYRLPQEARQSHLVCCSWEPWFRSNEHLLEFLLLSLEPEAALVSIQVRLCATVNILEKPNFVGCHWWACACIQGGQSSSKSTQWFKWMERGTLTSRWQEEEWQEYERKQARIWRKKKQTKNSEEGRRGKSQKRIRN